MRQSHWLASAQVTASPDRFIPTPERALDPLAAPVASIVATLPLAAHTLPVSSTYQEIARFFANHPQAIGVMIANHKMERVAIAAMISRQRFLEWRSQTQQWRQVAKRPLHAEPTWWSRAQNYLLIDCQTSLDDAATLILQRLTPNDEPVVLRTAAGFGLTATSGLLIAHTRWLRSQQSAADTLDLVQLRQQHRLVLNSVDQGIYGLDQQGHVTFINPAAVQMIGWSAQDLIGRSMHEVLHHSRVDRSPYSKPDCPLHGRFHDGTGQRVINEVFWRKDGTCFPVECTRTPLRDAQGTIMGAIVAFRDTTQQQQATAMLHRVNQTLEQKVQERTTTLHQLNEQLKILSERRSHLVTRVCQEFDNSLNQILRSVVSLERYSAQLSVEQKQENLHNVQSNVEHLMQMLKDVSLMNQVETKKIHINPDVINLAAFCSELVDELQYHHQDHVIEIFCRHNSQPVRVDRQLIRTILINLLCNSIRYSPVLTSIRVKLACHDHQVAFQIQDEGIGIAADDQPQIFEPFYRGRNVSHIPGTGLGLSIVKRFVDLQQGMISVKSQLGQGTIVTVMLPVMPAL